METRAEKLELEFDLFFESLQYQRVSKIVGSSPQFDNADYINFEKSITVELKIIDKDFFAEGGVIDKFQMLFAVPENIDSEGQGFYQIKLPDRNREGKRDTIEEPLRRILKKANKQLRETKEKLLNNQGFGFAMLAINLQTTINPQVIQGLTIKLLEKEFSSISGVIFCTPKFGLIIDGYFQPVCLHCNDHDLPKHIQEEVFYISKKWCDFIDNGGHN